MSCVLYNWMAPIHPELLEKNKMVDKDLYTSHLHQANESIQQAKPDNKGYFATTISDRTRRRLSKQRFRGLSGPFLYPSSSSDITPTDYHVRLSLANQTGKSTADN